MCCFQFQECSDHLKFQGAADKANLQKNEWMEGIWLGYQGIAFSSLVQALHTFDSIAHMQNHGPKRNTKERKRAFSDMVSWAQALI